LISTSGVLDLAPLALFKILNVPGAAFVSQSNLVSLLNKVLTLVSNTIQLLVLLKCTAIKQTMSLGFFKSSSVRRIFSC
jgi:hypothetical protein